MTAAVWTFVGIIGAAFVALAVDTRMSHRELRMDAANLSQGLRSEMTDLARQLRSDMTDLGRGLRTELHTEMAGIRHELRRLAEGQAEMNGQLTVLRQLSHTHEPT